MSTSEQVSCPECRLPFTKRGLFWHSRAAHTVPCRVCGALCCPNKFGGDASRGRLRDHLALFHPELVLPTHRGRRTPASWDDRIAEVAEDIERGVERHAPRRKLDQKRIALLKVFAAKYGVAAEVR
jgi:hypothetical protein